MRTIEERRNIIVGEMEAGRGSIEVSLYPVQIEPLFKPFYLQVERKTFLQNLFQVRSQASPYIQESIEANRRLLFVRIKPSRDDKNSLESAEHFLISLTASGTAAFELVGHDKKIAVQAAVEESRAEDFISQIRSHFPGADTYITKEDLLRNAWSSSPVARCYRLKSTHFLPLVMSGDGDPYRTLFGFLSSLPQSHVGILQVLFAPVRHDWQDNMRKASRNKYDPSQSPFIDLPKLPQVVDKKLSKPLFAVGIRMFASSVDLLSSMEGFFKRFDDGENGIAPVNGIYPPGSILERSTHVHGAILNSAELSLLMHLPSPDLIDSIPSIDRAARSYPIPDEYTLDGPILGYNLHRGIRREVRHSCRLPNRHVYVTGKSGYGKSNLILYVVMQRIEHGDGIGVIDPHGALVKDILKRIPKARVNDVVYFNAGDFKFPMAVNPLAHGGTKLEKEHIRVDLLNFFEDLFEAPLGVNVQHVLNFALITLLTRRDSTLQDIERLLIDKAWRARFLQGVEDDRVLMFWEHEFPQLERRGITTSIMNKLSPLILPDSTIAPMLRQRENKVDFKEMMDNRRIALFNLSHGDIGKRNSQLLGKLLVSKLQIAGMMRDGDGACADFFLHVDEFQHMLSPSMADILSGARKYGLHLWLTNQMTGDIPDSILRHVFNSSTLISFATDNPNDQMLVEKNLSKKFKAEDIGQLKRGETFVKMVGSAFNMTTERVAEHPIVNYADEIIALSRAKYASSGTTTERASDVKAKAHQRTEVKAGQDRPVLSPQERSFLEGVFSKPTLHIRALYKALSLSGYMGDKLKSSVKEKGLISEVTTSGPAKIVVLTPQGFNALNIELGPDTGKGGTMHRYWQSVIRYHAEIKGYKAVIEASIPGGKETVDVGLSKDDARVAIEVSITTKAEHEVGNVRKCLKAGYSQVVTLFLDETKLVEFKVLIEQALTDEERSRVLYGPINAFCQIL